MKRLFLFFLCCSSLSLFSQVLNVTNVWTTGHFSGCSGSNTPTVSITYVSGSGSSFSNGSIVCTNPCGNTTIKVTISNIKWSKNPGDQWLHGIFLPANAGYSVSGINLPTGFVTYNGGCTGGCPQGIVTGPGFYYDATTNSSCCNPTSTYDGTPCNNWGQQLIDCNTPFGLEFNLTFCNSTMQSTIDTFTLRGTGDGLTGCWSGTNGLSQINTLNFAIQTVACAPVMNTPVSASAIQKSCSGNTVNYTATLTGGCGNGTTVTWWDAPTGGNMIGSGSPFVYDPPGSACPAGTTLYASCCPGGTTTCVSRTPITITGTCDPAMSMVSASSTSGNCAVLSSINSVLVSNSSGVITYTLTPGNVSNTTGIFTGLSQSAYTVTVTDGSSCSTSTLINFTPIVLPTLSTSFTAITCSGGLSTITASGSGTSAPYQYNLNNGVWQSADSFVNITAGTYTVGVMDAGGCSATTIVTIAQPSPLLVSAVYPNILCFGNSTTLTSTGSGGTGAYQYSLNGGAFGSSNVFPNIAAGTYTIQISDANSCTGSTVQTINQPALLTATVSPPTLSCFNSTGILTVNANGGTVPSYQYNLNAGGYQTVNQFTVGAGTYTVSVYDGNNCSLSTTVIVSQPPVLTGNASFTPILCNGGTSTLTITAGGGTPGYQYSMNGVTFTSSNIFTGISSGSYTVTVQDANGCTKTSVLTITQPSAITLGATASVLLCNGGTGVITASAGGGTGAYQYSLNGGPLQTSPVFNNLIAGTYTVAVQDANGCTKSALAVITQPTTLTVSLGATAISCYGGTSLLTVTASGGNNVSYSYSLNNGPQQTSNIFNGLLAGTYTVVVKDANNCTASSQITISQPPSLTASILPSYILCNGGTAVFTMSGNGGTPGYQYSLNGGAYQTGNLYSGNPAGSYTLTVKDANACTASTTLLLTQPPVLTLSATSSTIACNGLLSTITANASGGTTPVYQYSMNGGSLQLSNSFPNIITGNYTVMVTDGNNCSATTVLSITQPLPLALTLSSTSILCNGGTSTLTCNASGGTSPYQYSLNGGTFQLNNVYSNLLPGTYTVQIKDAHNCTTTSSVSITQPQGLTVTSSFTAISCYGGSSVVTVTATGGVAAYSYSLNGGVFQSSNTFTASAGSYTVTVQDANNCTASTSATISQPSLLGLTLTSPGILCFGGNATVTANTNGGITPYQYSLNGGTNQFSNAFPNLSIGGYTVVVTDANGCSKTSNIMLTQPSPLQINNIASTIPSCVPGNDAIIMVSASGGITTYQYSLNGGSYQSSNTFNNLGVSVYTIMVKDANGCTATSTTTITNPNSPVITGTLMTMPSCNGFSNGSITVTATSFSTLTYQLQPGNVTNTSGLFSSVSANTYTVQVVDANQCAASSVVVVQQPSPVTINAATVQSVLCYNSTNGAVQVSASGGTGLITYLLQPGNQTNVTGVFSSLSGGLYTVIASDANQCSTTTILSISIPSQIVFNSFVISHEHCHNSGDGSIQVQGLGGSGTLSYTITPGGQTNTSGTFNGLSANTYTVQVSDANGCTISASALVLNPSPVSFQSVNHTDILCIGSNNGSISVMATGGSGIGYTYNLMPGNQNNAIGIFNNLGVNLYTVTASDQNNCTVTTLVNVITPTPVVFALDSMNNVTCNGGSNGALYSSASGGMPPYNYTIYPQVITNTTGDFLNLSSGSYTVVVTDANGCTLSLGQVTIAQPPSMFINLINLQDVSCYGGNDGTFTVQILGGTPTYNLNLQPSAGNFTPPGTFTSMTANNYTVTVTDGVGCTLSTIITVHQDPQLKFDSLEVKKPACFGDVDGLIHAYASGGTGGLTYQLNGANSTMSGFFQNLPPGNYLLSVSDMKGCSIDTMIQLQQPNLLGYSWIQTTPVDCDVDTNARIQAQGIGGNPPYTYILRPFIKINNSGLFTDLHSNLYTLTLKDANGCQVDTIITIYPPSKYMEILIDRKDIGCFGNGREGQATANVLNGTPPYTYTWSTVPIQFTQTADSLKWGYYFLEVIDARGCTRHDTVFIKPGECCDEVFVPNAFTPNNDGLNDVFKLTTAAGIEIMDFIVFNRWGSKVWLTYDISRGWDGTYLGQPQDSNTFYYMLKYRCIHDGSIHLKKGDVMLIR